MTPEPTTPERDTKNQADTTAIESDDGEYPKTKVVLPTALSSCLAVFLIALDRTIIGVAVPAISDQFHSFGDISWYESAYLLTFCALQLPMGKFYTYYPAKWVFVINVIIFEIGSLICAAAPNSNAFIVGRAIAGIGSAGGTTGGSVIFSEILPLEKRPKYQGFLGATFGLASVLGPILGGVFTTNLTWRWCFWINLPIGGAALLALLLILPASKAPRQDAHEFFFNRIKRFDPIGTAFVTPGLVLLLLALQWGGEDNSWNSARVIACLVVGLVLIIAFAVCQPFLGDNATLPARLLRNRSIWASCLVSLGLGSTLIIVTFYLPIWYQGIKGDSAQKAGLRLIPYFLATVFGVITGSFAVSKVGYYTPFMIVGTALMIVGTALLSTLTVTTEFASSAGFQVLTGVGIGLTLAQGQTAANTVLSREDIPLGLTIVNFGNFFGGTVFVSVSQGVLSNTLTTQLKKSLPGFGAASLSTNGATDLTRLVPADKLPLLQEAYNKGIDNVFYCALAVSCLAFVAAFFVEWRSVKRQPVTGPA